MAFPNNPVNNQTWSEGGRQYRYSSTLPGWLLSGAAGGDQDFGGNRAIHLADGVDPTDAVNLSQLNERAMRAGDLGGSSSTTTVEKIQGQGIATTAPTNGQDLRWNGSVWAAATNTVALSGDVTATGDASAGALTATVEKIRGSNVATTAPTSNNQFLKWNQTATQWEPAYIQSLQNRGVSNAVPNQNDVLAYVGTQWQPIAAGAGLTDSPASPEGVVYGRSRAVGATANNWERVTEEAPNDGFTYGRKDEDWQTVTEEAPLTGRNYVRSSGAWAEAPPPIMRWTAPGHYTYVVPLTGRYQCLIAAGGGGGCGYLGSPRFDTNAGSPPRFRGAPSGQVGSGIVTWTKGQSIPVIVPQGTPADVAFAGANGYVGYIDGGGPWVGWPGHSWNQTGQAGGGFGTITAGASPTANSEAGAAGVRVTGNSYLGANTVQVVSGKGGDAGNPGGNGQALIAYIGP